ncbi:MAG: S8 family peptidase [Zoogloea sp.]|uniref:S8 family peptidase n=1 Tax=Zoogloea sp. TaxID=49181 RepID=UPI003F30FFD6
MKMMKQCAMLAVFGALAAVTCTAQAQSAGQYVVQYYDTAVQSPVGTVTDPRLSSPTWSYLDSRVVAKTKSLETQYGFQATHMMSETIKGFTAYLTATQYTLLKANPNVSLIEADRTTQASGVQLSVATPPTSPQIVPWTIPYLNAHISRLVAGDGTEPISSLGSKFMFVLDTGVAPLSDLVTPYSYNILPDTVTGDCHGHGTQVAGIIGARDNTSGLVGIASSASIMSVRVLGCNGTGTMGNLIKGIDLATRKNPGRSVVNLSMTLSSPETMSAILSNTMNAASAKGLVFSTGAEHVAGGCSALSQAVWSSGGVVAGAVDSTGVEPAFASAGQCQHTWVPGANVLTFSRTGAIATVSGMGYATAHASAAIGLLLIANPNLTTSLQIRQHISYASFPNGKMSKAGRPISVLSVASTVLK